MIQTGREKRHTTAETRTGAKAARSMKALIGRGDMLDVLATVQPEDRDEAFLHLAGLCGYEVTRPAPAALKLEPLPKPLFTGPSPEPPTPVPSPAARQAAKFVRIEEYSRTPEVERQIAKPVELEGAKVLEDKDFAAPPAGMEPARVPLMPWSRLDGFVRKALGRMGRSHAYDLPAILNTVARGRPLKRLPRARRQGWAPRATLLIDRDPSLTPFWDDQSAFYQRLLRRRGSAGLQVYLLERSDFGADAWDVRKDAPVAGPIPFPERGSPVLLLSDCGYLRPNLERQRDWRAWGRRLRRHGCRTVALAPCPRDRWPHDAFDAWVMACWDRVERCPMIADEATGGGYGPRSMKGPDEEGWVEEARQRRAEILLRLLSPAVRIESGLLRDGRLMLQHGAADVGAEADAWVHSWIAAASHTAIALDPERARASRRRGMPESHLLRVPATAFGTLIQAIKRHHDSLSPMIWLEEQFHLNELAAASDGDSVPCDSSGTLKSFQSLPENLAHLVKTFLQQERLTLSRAAWALRFVDRFSPDMRPGNKLLAAVFWLARKRLDPDAHLKPMPEGFLEGDVAWLRRQEESRWRLWQHGVDFKVHLPARTLGPSVSQQGCPVLEFATRLGAVRVDEISAPNLSGPAVRLVELPPPHPTGRIELSFPAKLSNEWESWTLAEVTRPTWAAAMGRDHHGLWADLEVSGAVQRMRWINPGAFLMGSPLDEPGRREPEGPRHQVTLTRGYWLADTPCTQEFWMAVTGTTENPARFQSLDRPVEQVSWDDCVEFLRKLPALEEGGMAWRLPTEAEWEFSCRAGTETALYTGPIEILGANKAPALHPIAWYGGNSGVDFDLENGSDSSGWPDKEFDHQEAGTHPVKGKRANGWGLYDMIGNVWEWCADWWSHKEYQRGDVSDPPGPRSGGSRVFRGGGWLSGARSCRSACRSRNEPGYRYYGLGFRFAQGQQIKQAEARMERGERIESRAEREPRPRRQREEDLA